MDEPSRKPDSSPPPSDDDRPFWIAFYAPIALFVLALVLGAAGQGGGGAVFFWLAAFAAAVSPIVCGIIVGTRRGIGAGVLTFLGVLMLYVAIAFAGCMLVLRSLRF
jgi:hypothetical protein